LSWALGGVAGAALVAFGFNALCVAIGFLIFGFLKANLFCKHPSD
jgi:hypothetical protein